MYYPKSVYNINENITHQNMRNYERMANDEYKARKEKEKELGRKMTLKERYEFNKQFEENYYI